MHAVRKEILQILKEQEGATVAELAERLGMAAVSVRHHLDILQGDNLISVDRVERKGCVGRPQQIYVLTGEACAYFPNNFAALAGNLARQLKQVLPPDQVPCAFRAMAHEIACELGGAGPASVDLETRLEQVTDFLNERGYLARWEPASENRDDGYLLHKCNCPYAGVAAEHRELCLMDQALVEELVGQPCRRTQSMAENARCCTYQIQTAVQGEIPLVGV
jgi:DeoR family transcriptional regulator, suf operon transcriptional repressor